MFNGESPRGRYDGKVALITGSSRGIGWEIARRMSDEGARVCLTARHGGELTSAIDRLPTGTAIGIAGNVDDPDHRMDVVHAVAETFGGLDVLINNAAMNPVYGPLSELSGDIARKMLDVNVLSALLWTQAILNEPRLGFRERHGVVINVSSSTGFVPGRGIGWYGVTKAAVTHLTTTLAAELAPDIRVNAIAPAVIQTKFSQALYRGREEAVASEYPLGRLGVATDVASMAAWLASSEASWVTGQTLHLDGGLSAVGGSIG